MIEFEGASHRYSNGVLALDSVDLEIEKGEFVAIVGKNGCGKSTMMRHINALLLPTQGKVMIDGMDTSNPSNIWQIRQRVGMVFQNPQTQFVGTTVEEDVAFGPENLAIPQKEIQKRVEQALEDVGLSQYRERSPKSLSGGQMQRVAIAGVLAMKPDCIVLDEVTSMLDPGARAEVLETVRGLKGKRTIIYTTHLLEEVVDADRIILMERGRIVQDDSPTVVFNGGELKKHGFKIPPIVELANRLHEAGLVGRREYSAEGLVEEICQSISET